MGATRLVGSLAEGSRGGSLPGPVPYPGGSRVEYRNHQGDSSARQRHRLRTRVPASRVRHVPHIYEFRFVERSVSADRIRNVAASLCGTGPQHQQRIRELRRWQREPGNQIAFVETLGGAGQIIRGFSRGERPHRPQGRRVQGVLRLRNPAVIGSAV